MFFGVVLMENGFSFSCIFFKERKMSFRGKVEWRGVKGIGGFFFLRRDF